MAHEALQRLEALVRGKRYKDYAGTFLSQGRWLSDFLTASSRYPVRRDHWPAATHTTFSTPLHLLCPSRAAPGPSFFVTSVAGPPSSYRFKWQKLSHGAVINSHSTIPSYPLRVAAFRQTTYGVHYAQ